MFWLSRTRVTWSVPHTCHTQASFFLRWPVLAVQFDGSCHGLARVIEPFEEVDEAGSDFARIVETRSGHGDYQGPDVVEGNFLWHHVAELTQERDRVQPGCTFVALNERVATGDDPSCRSRLLPGIGINFPARQRKEWLLGGQCDDVVVSNLTRLYVLVPGRSD